MRIVFSIILSLTCLCLYSQQGRLGIVSPDSIPFSLSVDKVMMHGSHFRWEGPVKAGKNLEIELTVSDDTTSSILQSVRVKPNYHLTLELMAVGQGIALVEFSETPLDSVYVRVATPSDTLTTDSTVAVMDLPESCSRAMNEADLIRIEMLAAQAMLDRLKLRAIEEGSAGLCMDTEQLASLAEMIAFEDARLAFCLTSYPRLIDKQNFGLLSRLFLLSAYQRDFADFVESQLE